MKTLPPQPELVYFDSESREILLCWEEPGADQHHFFEWLASACEHGPLGHLVSHRLGNIAKIGFLRTLFSKTPECFPTLLSKVVYSGVHAGDMLNLSDVEHLAREVLAVQLTELVHAARMVRKPIVF